MRRLNHEHIFVVPYAAIPALELPQELVHYATSMRDDPALMRNLNELGKIYLGERSHASRTCLLHGDYYPGSWFRHADLGAMVLDPEFAFHGAPEFDVGVMMAHLLMTGIMTGIAPSQPMPLLQTYSTPEGLFDATGKAVCRCRNRQAFARRCTITPTGIYRTKACLVTERKILFTA